MHSMVYTLPNKTCMHDPLSIDNVSGRGYMTGIYLEIWIFNAKHFFNLLQFDAGEG